jgi:DUF1680 family protein
MLDLELDGTHADVMERALLNNVLAGLSLDGRTFFYVNPLEIVPAVAKRRHDTHLVKTQRVPWFGCACCPPNVARLLASIGAYACSIVPDGIAVHLYFGGSIETSTAGVPVRIVVNTKYPWEERVEFAVEVSRETEFALHLRMPGWCRAPRLTLNGAEADAPVTRGYARIQRKWRSGDRLVLELPMPVERVRADARVAAAAGMVAIQRGPIVYCAEEVDNGPDLAALSVPRDSKFEARFDPNFLGGCVVVEAEADRTFPGKTLYSSDPPATKRVRIRAVPYALWANRGEG